MYDGRYSHRPAGPRRRGLGRVLRLSVSRARKTLPFLLSKTFNQRFAFTFVAFAVIISKIVHIVAHERGLPRRHLALWSFSFVTQDLVLLILLRAGIEWLNNSSRKALLLRVLGRAAISGLMAFSAMVSVVNIAFFSYTRSEVVWRNVAFAGDSSSRGVLMSGSVALLAVLCILTAIAATFQTGIFSFARVALDVIKWPLQHLRTNNSNNTKASHRYTDLPYTSLSDDSADKTELTHTDPPLRPGTYRFSCMLWSVAILAEILSFLCRPSIGSLTYMSWTAPLVPFVDLKISASNLQRLRPVHHSGISDSWDDKTALSDPIPFPWLPETVLSGFEDWYEPSGSHYNATADPLKISNLMEDVLPQLKKSLAGITIKHIIFVVLESTRKDVFPIKKNGLIWNRLANTYRDGRLPDLAADRMQSLTPIASHLTGDFNDGFPHDADSKPRGGLNFKNAYTSATYTLKSMVGIMCGIWPLIADLNMEYLHHIYQPCLPQILAALNRIDDQNASHSDGANLSKWRSHFLQSITLAYDNSDIGTEQFGFPRENIIDSRYLRSDAAKFGTVHLPDVNYFGFEEPPLLDYFRDAFVSAKTNGERVFLTHVTSTTHHPYRLPANETVVPLGNGRLRQLSNYVNSVGYDDRWLGQILNLLDELGVAEETLVVFTGDHGISLPENDKPASYYNPNTGCNHVPLVFSHPKLPAIDVAGSVSTMEILPTILDLLRETGSLTDAASAAAGDLMANYEGQSLIRSIRNSSSAPAQWPATQSSKNPLVTGDNAVGNWQFIVMNPGRAMVGIRDRRREHWRLVAPVLKNVVWRFNDLETDPTDKDAIESFDFASFLHAIEKKHSKEAAEWAEEAAFIVRWFVDENNKRWQYGQYALPTDK